MATTPANPSVSPGLGSRNPSGGVNVNDTRALKEKRNVEGPWFSGSRRSPAEHRKHERQRITDRQRASGFTTRR
jgi:hypothetical protein